MVRIQQILDDEPFSIRSITYTLDENNMIIYLYITFYLKKIFRLYYNPLTEIRSKIWKQSDKRKICLQLDNSKVHNSKLSMKKYDELWFKRPRIRRIQPDMVPSDFYLFVYLEEKLQGNQFIEIEDLEEALHEILDTISYDQRKAVFESWIKRCDWVSANNGEYYHNIFKLIFLLSKNLRKLVTSYIWY